MSDRLSALLARFELRAKVGHHGALSADLQFSGLSGSGQLHLLRAGALLWLEPGLPPLQLDQPCAVLVPRARTYRLQAVVAQEAELISAGLQFGLGDENPILRGLPDRLVIPLSDAPALDGTLQLLFGEAHAQRCGHDAVVDRLIEVLLVQLLRVAIERKQLDSGLLSGLSDLRLAKAFAALHAEPARSWTLETLAAAAGMSRARYAARFAELVGLTPGEYLMHWRIGLAKSMLRQGASVKSVAQSVGYGSPSALARVFTQQLGVPPRQWLLQQAAH